MNEKLKKLSVVGLQNLRSTSPGRDIVSINAMIMAKLRGERTVAPFIREISYSHNKVHKERVILIFEVRSTFMPKKELDKLIGNNDPAYVELANKISEVNGASIKDSLVVNGDDDYEKRGKSSKIM